MGLDGGRVFALPDAEIRYKLLFENSLDAIFLTSPDGRIYDANASACFMFQRSREEIIAAGRAGLMDTSDPRLLKLLEQREKTGKAVGELTGRRADGSLFPAEVSSSIFTDEMGLRYTCTIIHDISARRHAEAERERLFRQREEALAQVRLLTGLLPVCAACKKIRDNRGYWLPMERYIREHSEAQFTHGICPDCEKTLYPDELI